MLANAKSRNRLQWQIQKYVLACVHLDAFYKTFPSQFRPFCSSVIPVAIPQGTISARLTLKCNYHGNKL